MRMLHDMVSFSTNLFTFSARYVITIVTYQKFVVITSVVLIKIFYTIYLNPMIELLSCITTFMVPVTGFEPAMYLRGAFWVLCVSPISPHRHQSSIQLSKINVDSFNKTYYITSSSICKHTSKILCYRFTSYKIYLYSNLLVTAMSLSIIWSSVLDSNLHCPNFKFGLSAYWSNGGFKMVHEEGVEPSILSATAS